MRKSFRRTIAVLMPLAAIAAVVWFGTRPEPVAVRVTEVGRGDVEATVANTRAGTVRAFRRAKLAPAIGGEVAVLSVKEGERVARGQLMLALWNDDLQAQLRQARAELDHARAQRDQADEFAQNAEREAGRLVELKASSIASSEEVETAGANARAAAAACRAAEAQIRVTEGRIGVIEAQIERSELRAPFAGIVAEINAELGEYATPSPPGIPTLPAVDLIDDSSIYVRAPIDEVDAPMVVVGQEARITMDAFADREFAGRVTRIAPYVLDREKQARTVDVDVEFVERPVDVALLAGYSADVEVVLERRRDVLRVPTEAILDGDRVLAIDDDTGVLIEREVRPGLANWHFTEVLEGLSAGDRIVLSPGRDGVSAGAVARAVDETVR